MENFKIERVKLKIISGLYKFDISSKRCTVRELLNDRKLEFLIYTTTENIVQAFKLV